jgi:hypothetical protein
MDLLELTSGYEGLVVGRCVGVANLAVLAWWPALAICSIAYELADAGDTTSAAILMCGITKSVFTLAWLNEHPELAEIVWMRDEIRNRRFAASGPALGLDRGFEQKARSG